MRDSNDHVRVAVFSTTTTEISSAVAVGIVPIQPPMESLPEKKRDPKQCLSEDEFVSAAVGDEVPDEAIVHLETCKTCGRIMDQYYQIVQSIPAAFEHTKIDIEAARQKQKARLARALGIDL